MRIKERGQDLMGGSFLKLYDGDTFIEKFDETRSIRMKCAHDVAVLLCNGTIERDYKTNTHVIKVKGHFQIDRFCEVSE